MLHEFAIDPRVLSRWQTYSHIVHDCGVENGRLISDFPNRWRKMVLEACRDNTECSERELKKIEFDLQHRAPAKLVAGGRRYDFNDADWLGQAEREDKNRPFRAIVSSANPRTHKKVLVSSELDKEEETPWRVSRSCSIPREPSRLAAIAEPLLKISREVRFVDPHFDPEKRRYQESHRAFLECLSRCNPQLKKVEFHLEIATDGRGHPLSSAQEFAEVCCKHLKTPPQLSVAFHRWKQREGGDQFHRRMVLTERGGIAFDVGLDRGKSGEFTDVDLLSATLHARHWQTFSAGAGDGIFSLMDSTILRFDTQRCQWQATNVL
jgi:hypothetical protein